MTNIPINNLILASSSPRRAQLIHKIAAGFCGLKIQIIPPDIVESLSADETPQAAAVRLAYQKAQAVYSSVRPPHGTAVLGCDTVVALNGVILGKPADKNQAESFFRLLCGRTHHVITGVSILFLDANAKKPLKIIKDFEKSYVTFGAFCEKIVYNYIQSGAPFDKAGGYGFQDKALSPLITAVKGCTDNIIGLPTALLTDILHKITAH
ncbi:MAG: Maf family protein [Firmicutes bacterium]|nr:Maf family protein [Bacillota bacterium]